MTEYEGILGATDSDLVGCGTFICIKYPGDIHCLVHVNITITSVASGTASVKGVSRDDLTNCIKTGEDYLLVPREGGEFSHFDSTGNIKSSCGTFFPNDYYKNLADHWCFSTIYKLSDGSYAEDSMSVNEFSVGIK